VKMSEEDLLNLSGKEWTTLPRLSRTIPFGYKVDDDDPTILQPIIFELEALEQAKKHLRQGYSLRVVANWLSDITGRRLSHMGLKKRIEIERRRTNQARTLKKWAETAKDAYQKAKDFEKRLGKNTFDLEAETNFGETSDNS